MDANHPHAAQIVALRRMARANRDIAHALEREARLIECHVVCVNDPSRECSTPQPQQASPFVRGFKTGPLA